MEEEILLEAGRLEYLQVFLNKKKKKKETRVFISYRRIGLDSQKKTRNNQTTFSATNHVYI